MARRPLEPGEDLETATDDFAEWLTQTFPICDEPLDREELIVVGEPARLLRFYCSDGFDVFDVVTVRAGAMYLMAYIAPQGDIDAARAALDAMLASLSFAE